MDKLKSALWAKILSFVLLYFTIMLTIVSAVSIGFMVYYDFYTRSKDSIYESVMGSAAESELNHAYNRYLYKNAEYYYKDKNVKLEVVDGSGEKLFSNYNNQKVIAKVSGDYYIERFADADDNIYTEDEVYYSKNNAPQYFAFKNDLEVTRIEKQLIKVTVFIPQEMEFTDRFFVLYNLTKTGYSMRYAMPFLLIVSIILTIFLTVFSFSAAGHTKKSEEISLNFLDKIPLDLYLAILSIIVLFCISLIDFVDGWLLATAYFIGLYTVSYICLFAFLLSFATRIKATKPFENTVIYKVSKVLLLILKKAFKLLLFILTKIPMVIKCALYIAVVCIFDTLAIVCFRFDTDMQFFTVTMINALATVPVLVYAIGFKEIKKGIKTIAEGDLEYQIDERYMFGEIKEFADNLNSINDNISSAVNEKVRSERLKTELITNVSHDIKTPLTSIINYADLIKKEQCDNEKISEYAKILEKHSLRLKRLTEDLVEVSKAQTGNLEIRKEPSNVYVLLTQALGEYDEKLKVAELEVVLNFNCQNCVILADGQKLWRVFDNLLGNICKYAQPHTRVYISLEETEKSVLVTFKNISASPLNISSKELTERFVRGDRSRNTEGSGLGLSIAKSFVELQDGIFEISIDGDLFKAKITFEKNMG